MGATWDGAGVNCALFSEHATGVELYLFAGDRYPLEGRSLALLRLRRARGGA